MRIVSIFYFLICCSCSVAYAKLDNFHTKKEVFKDYGVHGHLFSIEEQSVLEEIMEKLESAEKSGKLKEMQAGFVEKVKQRMLRPMRVENISRAKRDRSWTYDPSYTQEQAITDGKGKVIVAAGTTVNALDKLKWGEDLIFIDGDDKEQIEFARRRKGKIVLIGGMPIKLSEELGRRVYFDQGGIYCGKFKIESVPAIVEQDGKRLKISEVSL